MTNRFIEKLRGFGVLNPDDEAELAEATSKPRQVRAKHDLIREGDRPGPVFVILQGWACRYKILPNGSRQVLAFMMPGDCCDLNVRLLAEMDHSIQTITSAVVATISPADMTDLMDRRPRIAKVMYMAQLVDEGTMRAWITSMGRRSSRERVAHLMCELYLRAHKVGVTSSYEFALPLSQLMLSDALGITPVHLNRVMKELRLMGVMDLKRGNLVIINPEKLVEVAGFDENYLHQRLRKAE